MMVPRTGVNGVTCALKTTVVLTSIRAAFYASSVADASVYADVNKPLLKCRKPANLPPLPKLAGMIVCDDR